MTFLVALVATQALIFPGGSAQDLSGTLSKWSKGAAVTLLDDRGSYRAFRVEKKVASDPKDVARLALGRGEVKLAVLSLGVGASRGIYGMEVREPYYPPLEVVLEKRGQRIGTVPEEAFLNGRANLITNGDAGIAVRDLTKQKFAKPLRMHWLFERMAVSVYAEGTEEVSFLKVLASAIGAKWVVTSEEYRLDLDPAAVREFAIRTVENSPDDPHDPAAYAPYRQLGKRLAATAWREASDRLIATAFEKANGATAYKPSRSSTLVPLIRQKLEMMIRLAHDESVGASTRETLNFQLGMADLDGEPRIVLASNLSVAIALPAKGGGTILL